MSAPPLDDSSSRPRGIPLLLVAAVAIVFGRLLWADFSSLDDPYNIWMNARLNPPTFSSIAWYWAHPENGLYIPLTYTVWGILAAFARVSPDPNGVALNPNIFHFANVLIHALGTLLVYGILKLLITDRRAACLGALLYAMHPLQVEPVAWAAGLKDVLAGMLALAAIDQYIRFVQVNSRRHYLLASLALVAAMLAKPSAMTVPLIVAVIDWLLLDRSVKAVARSIWPWAVLAALCAIIARIAQNVTGLPEPPLWARPILALDSLAFYLYKLLWPMKLAVDYGHRPSAVMASDSFKITWMIPVAIAVLLWIWRRRVRPLIVACLIFVCATLPVLGLASFQYQFASTTADHYVYLAMLGPALAVAWWVRQARRRDVAVIIATIIGLLGIRSMIQARVWMNDVALFTNAVAVNPTSMLALNNLGNAYREAGQFGAAEQQFRRVSQLYPDYPEGHSNVAWLLELRGELSEAIEFRRRALAAIAQQPPELRSSPAPQWMGIGNDLYMLGRYAEAKDAFARALALRPGDADLISALEKTEQKLNEATQPATTTAPVMQ
jgi:tetratricopeptide (TPR) repeat protein